MTAPGAPWSGWVRRAVIQTNNYLGYDGEETAGGRQRHIRDLARLIRNRWERDVVIVQKGRRPFETTCPDGNPVIGLTAPLNTVGDPILGRKVISLVRPGDAVIYAAGEGAWPFFIEGSKGVQHGIYWDGPDTALKRRTTRFRVLKFAESMRSMLCVDTNFANWLRQHGAKGQELCRRCVYVPNYAALDGLSEPNADRGISTPPVLIYARRFQHKRGPWLFLDALHMLSERGTAFHARMFSVGGHEALRQGVAERGISDQVEILQASMDEIVSEYERSDVAVVPTLWSEGTSLAAVEAICSGVPVVATPVGGLGNLIVPGFNGYLVPPTPGDLSRAIARAIVPETWVGLRRNCLAMRPALSRERWDQAVLDWLDR